MNLRPFGAIVAVGVLVACAASGVRVFHINPAGDRGMRAQRTPNPAAQGSESGDAGEHRTIQAGGQTRSFYFHRPANASAQALPLVMVFHGGEGNARKIAQQTGFNDVADHNGFAVVYPESLDHWNDGRDATAQFGDDTDFVSALIADLVKTEGVDRTRVYATGASNGGLLTLRLACERSTEIAAFAAVAASFPDTYVSRCKPSRPVSIMVIHGTDDRLIRSGGGTIPSGKRGGVGGSVIPVPDTLEFWRKHDGCQPQPKTTSLPDTANDGTTVKVMDYQGCAAGVEMIFVDIAGGGHTWPGARVDPLGKLAGRVSHDIDASQVIWDFFRRHTLAGNPK